MNRDLIDRAELPDVRIEIPKRLDDETCRIISGLVQAFQTVIKSAPTVDAVEVVRCVNCVWYCEWRTKPGVFICGRPNNGGLVVKPDFFCKHGEQKEDDNGKGN